MKKSVVILIAIIYVAAIALVSFFGLQFKVFEEIVYVESIEILNSGIKTSESVGKYLIVLPDAEGNRRVQIEYRVHPDDATNKGVEFVPELGVTGVTVDENGVVTFESAGTMQLNIVAKDGSAETTIYLISP